MWQFFKRQQNKNHVEDTKFQEKPIRSRQLAFTEIAAEIGDFSDFLENDAAFKFWLPETAKPALKEMSDRYNVSASEFLRQFLAVHCYGLYAFYQMTDKTPKLFKDWDYSDNVRFSKRMPEPPEGKIRITTYWIPELGKNVAPIKIWIPKRMKADLQTLAEHVELTPSNYVREILISRLLGHGMLPQRTTMFKAFPTPAADDWAEGKEIPMREVSAEEFHASNCELKEVRTEWIDADE